MGRNGDRGFSTWCQEFDNLHMIEQPLENNIISVLRNDNVENFVK